MLSGLRVISRDEATSNLQHKEERNPGEGTKPSKRHKRHSKERDKSKRRKKKHRLGNRDDVNDYSEKRHRHGKSSRQKESLGSDSSPADHSDSSGSSDRQISRSRKRARSKKERYSDPSSSSDTESEESSGKPSTLSEGAADDGRSNNDKHCAIAARKAAGLEWMVKAPPPMVRNTEAEKASSEVQVEENFHVNPKELNPYWKAGGDGYPSESVGLQIPGEIRGSQASVVGDGGLSWRLKALKRAKEQAERECRKLDEVVEERWGSLADMTVSVLAKRAAHAHAHLHATRDRKRYPTASSVKLEGEREGCSGGEDKSQPTAAEDNKDLERITTSSRDYLKDVSVRDARMKAPRVTESLSWKRRKNGPGHLMRAEDATIFQAAASALNNFQNDGSFLQTFNEKQAQGANKQGNGSKKLSGTTCEDGDQQQAERSDMPNADKSMSVPSISTEGMSANQLAAKALQLRLRGKNKEADEVLSQLQNKKQEEEESSARQQSNGEIRPRHHEHHPSYKQSLKSIVGDYDRRSKKSDGGDTGLVENILHNKQYNTLTCVDDEYEFGSGGFEGSVSKKTKKKAFKNVGDKEAKRAIQAHKQIVTQEERCQFCFSNQSRPKHLTVSIGNSCYLMLPPWEPLVEGHCLIVPMQHEGSSRNVDENVWEEFRNYKKCLLQMFANQDKDVLFMETVTHLTQQRRHCLVECIPLPPNVAKQAPLYFKKAIDEAEDEWSQHNAKKLIDTSERGLRACIPKNFPYFHVEFGLRAGYVHVIDNEKDFKSDFGRNVVIGMLKLPEEEMHRRRRQQSHDQQKKAAVDFQKGWDPFDWTKMLD